MKVDDEQYQGVGSNDPVQVYKQLYRVRQDEEIPDFIRAIDLSNLPPPDFPHSLHHAETVGNYVEVMAETHKLDEKWRLALEIAATYHDISQGYTISGIMPTGFHPVASSVIAYIHTRNIDAANLIYEHFSDNQGQSLRLDDQLDAARRIIRDADQLAGSGMSGLIRASYYWGFRHEYMEMSQEDIMETRFLCDPRCTSTGLPDDHEKETRQFVFENVFPFLIRTSQLDRAITYARTNLDRFTGTSIPFATFLYELFRNKEILGRVQSGKQKRFVASPRALKFGGIDKTDNAYAYLFIRKPLHDFLILNTCREIQHYQAYSWDSSTREDLIARALRRSARGIITTLY